MLVFFTFLIINVYKDLVTSRFMTSVFGYSCTVIIHISMSLYHILFFFDLIYKYVITHLISLTIKYIYYCKLNLFLCWFNQIHATYKFLLDV